MHAGNEGIARVVAGREVLGSQKLFKVQDDHVDERVLTRGNCDLKGIRLLILHSEKIRLLFYAKEDTKRSWDC
jgi:hypothetical protein